MPALSLAGIDSDSSHQTLVTNYLDQLRGAVAESTWLSHQNAVQKFASWSRSATSLEPPKRTLSRFIEAQIANNRSSNSTVIGTVYSLLNFFAFHEIEGPDILKVQLARSLISLSRPNPIPGELIDEFTPAPSPGSLASFHRLLNHLRRRKYATRTHLFVEFVHSTAGYPTHVRNIDCSDVSLDENRVSIDISHTHLVSRAGLVQERTANLPVELASAVTTYLEHERHDHPSLDCAPLFTTSQGRASMGVLRRSVKQACNDVSSLDGHRYNSDIPEDCASDSMEALTPRIVRELALVDILENG